MEPIQPVEELVLKDLKFEAKGQVAVFFPDDHFLRLTHSPRENGNKWRRVAADLALRTVNVPEYLAPDTPRTGLGWLVGYLYVGHEEQSNVRIALVGEDNTLRTIKGEAACPRRTLYYRSDIGYSTM